MTEDFRSHTVLGRTGLRVSRLGVASGYGVPASAVERARFCRIGEGSGDQQKHESELPGAEKGGLLHRRRVDDRADGKYMTWKLCFPPPAWYKSGTERPEGSPTSEEAANTKFEKSGGEA